MKSSEKAENNPRFYLFNSVAKSIYIAGFDVLCHNGLRDPNHLPILQNRINTNQSHSAGQAGGGMNPLDQKLLSALTCLKALNFWQIAYIGRELDGLSRDQAAKILWQDKKPQSEQAFKWLVDLCGRRWVLPWRAWSPNHILTHPMGKSTVRKEDTFYILGKVGRKFLKEKMGITPPAGAVDELYLSSLPLARWLTASSCALALESDESRLAPLREVWTNYDGVPKPAFHPDFVIVENHPIAFYICDSPFALRSEYYVAHVGRSLNFMHPGSQAVILCYTKSSALRILQAINRSSILGENRSKVFVSNLYSFKDCHINGNFELLKFYDANYEEVQLLNKPVSTLGVPDHELGIAGFGSSSSSRPVESLR